MVARLKRPKTLWMNPICRNFCEQLLFDCGLPSVIPVQGTDFRVRTWTAAEAAGETHEHDTGLRFERIHATDPRDQARKLTQLEIERQACAMMPKVVGKHQQLTFGRGDRELKAVIKGLVLVLVRCGAVPRWEREQFRNTAEGKCQVSLIAARL